MGQDIASKQKTKKILAIVGCIAFVLACVLTIFFMKLPMVEFCDGGCNVGELRWASIADIVTPLVGSNVPFYLYTIPLMLGFLAFVGLFYHPGLIILFSVIMVLLIIMPIVAIVKTVKFCKNSKKIIFLVHGYNGIPEIFNYFKDTFEKNGYKVIMPSFPTQTDITIDRYFTIFDQHKNDLNDNTVLIAHSIGNIMSLKYLCENNIAICGYISLAGFGEPFVNEGRDDLNNVVAPLCLTDKELAKVPNLVGRAYSVYSDNDHIVPFSILKKYPTIIGAKDCFISGIGHMGSKSGLEELPEVVDIVLSMC